MKPRDQFYTKPYVAEACFTYFKQEARQAGLLADSLFFIEPSAGEGSFYDILPPERRTGIDIEPKHAGIIKGDFLTWTYRPFFYRRQETVVIGNPPFGKRSRLAVEFFNRAAEIADTLAFVLPVTFRKYRIHRSLNGEFAWIGSYPLERDAFYTGKQENYEVNTEFQIWTRLPFVGKDMRLTTSPPIKHSDFLLHQYNNTKEALLVFDERFAFAVPAQGYQDYHRRETIAGTCEKNKQWMLFDSDDEEVVDRLWQMDYAKMAYDCGTIVPGFRKNDVVREYIILHEAVQSL